jgi:hypothetical protein
LRRRVHMTHSIARSCASLPHQDHRLQRSGLWAWPRLRFSYTSLQAAARTLMLYVHVRRPSRRACASAPSFRNHYRSGVRKPASPVRPLSPAATISAGHGRLIERPLLRFFAPSTLSGRDALSGRATGRTTPLRRFCIRPCGFRRPDHRSPAPTRRLPR